MAARAEGTSPEQTLADRVAAAVTAVPGVAALAGGAFDEVATYLPGRRVNGVAERGDRLTVSFTATATGDLRETAERVRAAVAGVDPRPVDVIVADIAGKP